MVDRLMAHPEEVEAILASAVGCTITAQEHNDLEGCAHLDGWERYQAAGIRVVDTESGIELDDPRKAATPDEILYLIAQMSFEDQEKVRAALAVKSLSGNLA
jgi:hypothetical protein